MRIRYKKGTANIHQKHQNVDVIHHGLIIEMFVWLKHKMLTVLLKQVKPHIDNDKSNRNDSISDRNPFD